MSSVPSYVNKRIAILYRASQGVVTQLQYTPRLTDMDI